MEKYGKPRNILICCNFFVCSKFCALVLVRESCFWVKVLNTFHLKPSTPQSLSSAEDVTLFEQAGLACAPMRRMHGKHKAPVLPSKRPEPVKAPTPAVKRPAPSGKAKAKAKAKAKVKKTAEKAPPVEELLSSGKLPEDAVDRYEGLCAATLDDLKQMTDDLWLPNHGKVHELALRITRSLAGLEPLDEPMDEPMDDPVDPVDDPPQPSSPKKPAPKRKLRAGKMGAASRLRVGRGRGRGRSAGPKRRAARPPGTPSKGSKPQGPGKKKMRLFLTNFLQDVDIQTTTFGQLRAAATEHFGELSEEAIASLSDVAAVAMRKQLGVRKATAPEAPAPEAPEALQAPEAPEAAEPEPSGEAVASPTEEMEPEPPEEPKDEKEKD